MELAATLERIAGGIASTVDGPESLPNLGTAVRHLEHTCRALEDAARAMAVAATGSQRHARLDRPHPAARAVAWRLHHLSITLRASAETCAAAGGAAEAFERSVCADVAMAPGEA